MWNLTRGAKIVYVLLESELRNRLAVGISKLLATSYEGGQYAFPRRL